VKLICCIVGLVAWRDSMISSFKEILEDLFRLSLVHFYGAAMRPPEDDPNGDFAKSRLLKALTFLVGAFLLEIALLSSGSSMILGSSFHEFHSRG